MQILIALPVLLFLSCWFYFHNYSQQKLSLQNGLRSSMLTSYCFMGLAVTFSTEALSLFNRLNFNSLLLFYLIVISITCSIILSKKTAYRSVGYNLKFSWSHLGAVDKMLFFFLLLLFVVQAVISYVFPPNNWDSMTYHLPRVMHWMQNQSVAHYASNNPWQLFYPPFAEYSILHTYLLTNSDYFVQSIQWAAMIGSCVGVSLIIRELGASLKLQLWGSVLTATIPLGIYEAVSTQNDYVLTLWVVASSYYFLLFLRIQSTSSAIMLAISIGLCLKTKGTAYLFLAPIVLLYLGAILKRRSISLIKLGVMIAFIAISLNAYTYLLNINLYGDPLGLSVGKSATTPAFSLTTLYSNATRHLAYNLASDVKQANDFITLATLGLHRIMDLDVADPDISAGGYFFIPYGRLLYSENYAPSPFNILAFFLSVVVFYLHREKFDYRSYVLLFILLGGFTFFCAFLKWQFFAGRLLLPLLVLSTAFTALVWDKALIQNAKPKVAFMLFILLCLPIYQSAVHIAYAVEKPILSEKNVFNTPRAQLYFSERPGLQKTYQELVARITAQNNCKQIGLALGHDDWEYPLWVMLRQHKGKYNIYHTSVNNESRKLETSDKHVCLTVEISNAQNIARIKN